MILTCDVIRREIEAGRVVIEPFFADQVGPASIDLHLGDEIRVMHAVRAHPRAIESRRSPFSSRRTSSRIWAGATRGAIYCGVQLVDRLS